MEDIHGKNFGGQLLPMKNSLISLGFWQNLAKICLVPLIGNAESTSLSHAHLEMRCPCVQALQIKISLKSSMDKFSD